jgi:hypothetical protein
MLRRQVFVAPLVAALAWTLPVTASAQTKIGTTVGLSPLAEGSHAGSLVLGASVIQDEIVRTGPVGALELQFLDGTHLALDRSSSVKLDKFVYSVSKRGDQVVIGLTKGAFRFATGGLPKAAYRIQTPLASIGVRGTTLTIVSQRNETRVYLDEGGASVCSRRGGRACVDLDSSSRGVVVTADGRIARTNRPLRLSLACRQRGSSSLFCTGLQRRASLGGSVPGLPGSAPQVDGRAQPPPQTPPGPGPIAQPPSNPPPSNPPPSNPPPSNPPPSNPPPSNPPPSNSAGNPGNGKQVGSAGEQPGKGGFGNDGVRGRSGTNGNGNSGNNGNGKGNGGGRKG